jgi:hypothetical protein
VIARDHENHSSRWLAFVVGVFDRGLTNPTIVPSGTPRIAPPREAEHGAPRNMKSGGISRFFFSKQANDLRAILG